MFKYVKFVKVEKGTETSQFNANIEDVEVFSFDVDVVSLSCENEAKIDELIAMQDEAINCEVIEKDEFKSLVENSAQLNRIREVVKTKIADRYDVADEVAMSKRSTDDAKRVAYDAYVQECLLLGYALKSEIGY